MLSSCSPLLTSANPKGLSSSLMRQTVLNHFSIGVISTPWFDDYPSRGRESPSRRFGFPPDGTPGVTWPGMTNESLTDGITDPTGGTQWGTDRDSARQDTVDLRYDYHKKGLCGSMIFGFTTDLFHTA